MSATTTAFTACDAVLFLDNASGTPVDISGSTNTVDANFDNKLGEFKPFGTQWPIRVTCGKDASFTIKGVATTAIGEIRDLVENWFFNGSGARTFTFSLPDNNSGDVTYSAEVLLKSFKFSGDASSADPIMYDIELTPSGAVTRTVIS